MIIFKLLELYTKEVCLFFVLLWVSRFIVEFFKQAQVDGREDWIFGMNTGQTLSIPFILIGLYLMFKKNVKA